MKPKDCSGLPVFRLDGLDAAGGLPFLCNLISELRNCGLRVALVFSQEHQLSTDLLPMDHSRIFAAGGDIVSLGAEQLYLSRQTVSPDRIRLYLADLCQHYDIVLVVGETDLALPVLQLPEGETATGISACALTILNLLRQTLQQVPIWACVLIGGRSSRMGRAKHLLADGRGRTWLENTVAILEPFVGQVVLSGRGLVPESLLDLVRIPDIPGVAGPLAGILSAMRWQPEVSWLVVACDMPSLSPESLQWLIDSRQPGRWGTVPRRSADSHVEPLLAHYDRRCRSIFEEVLAAGSLRIGDVAGHAKIATPVIPAQFAQAWDNINTPEELRSSAL
ncbi:MAG: NTP transferase domain-containing protein [Desulfoprunum sp.]|nr:NTP transferase domain-containing protein [Desulfoprunum sp.]